MDTDAFASARLYVSIVGVDRLSAPYYKAKWAAEQVLDQTEGSWTLQRITQVAATVPRTDASSRAMCRGGTEDIGMSDAAIVMGANERPTPLDMGGEEITVLASAAQTNGYEVFLQVGAEGSGPPPHHHPWDEAFYVVRGEVVFGADGQESTLGAGSFVHIPGGRTHWFRLGAGGAEMLSFTSHEGAAGFFTAISRSELPPGAGLADIIRIAATHGATVLSPSS